MAYSPSLNYIFLSKTFSDENIAVGKKDFASVYAKYEPGALDALEKIIADFEAKQK